MPAQYHTCYMYTYIAIIYMVHGEHHSTETRLGTYALLLNEHEVMLTLILSSILVCMMREVVVILS